MGKQKQAGKWSLKGERKEFNRWWNKLTIGGGFSPFSSAYSPPLLVFAVMEKEGGREGVDGIKWIFRFNLFLLLAVDRLCKISIAKKRVLSLFCSVWQNLYLDTFDSLPCSNNDLNQGEKNEFLIQMKMLLKITAITQ